MDEETSYFGTSTGVYLGEFDNFTKYKFPDKRIKVKKYRNDNILVFHKDSIPIVGGKKHKTKRHKVKNQIQKNAIYKKSFLGEIRILAPFSLIAVI